WKYDQLSAAYLLLQSKKARGKSVQLRVPPVRARTRWPAGLETEQVMTPEDVPGCREMPRALGSMEFSDAASLSEESPFEEFILDACRTKEQSRHDAQRDDTEFTLSTPVTRKVASKKRENKENVDTESALRSEVPLVPPAPKTPLTNPTETQVQTVPFEVPAFKGGQFPVVTPIKKPTDPADTDELTAAEVPPKRRRCDSAEPGPNLAHVDSSQKKRKAKIFGSLERGLDRVITMLTPSKKTRSIRNHPRKLKAHYNVTATQRLNPNQLLNEIITVLSKKHVEYVQKGYSLKCQTRSDFGTVTMAFKLEVCHIGKPEVVGIRRQRLKGDAWVYKRLVEDIFTSCHV
ncbi:PREDICTED: maternal embryonic leucine zipper kinase, partial [Mesitornis unicolor]|uniref:maternal embryonic leucine zipper kinase n=1 Tax=Mesitornis unicolor TaxID=54374 RepID=UPI000528576E